MQWIDPRTNNVIAEIDLSAMQQFHFVDDDTLVGFNDQHQLQLVDLRDRSSETFSFVPPEQTITKKDDDAETPAESPLWSPRRLQVATDGLNIYLANRRKQKSRSMNGPSNRNMMEFTGDLQAIDRRSGEQTWSVQSDADLFATTDEMNLPLLLLIRPPVRNADGTIPSQSIFQGIIKLSGKRVFKQTIPTQGGLRMLSLTSKTVNSIDVGVPGLSMRIQGKPGTAEASPKE